MALTKVSGGILDPGINVAGIVTAIGFDGPFIGGIGDHIIAGIVTATGLDINGNADVSGSLTVGSGGLDLNGSGDISGDLVVGGNLTANGDFTTLNTTLREVELLRVDATNNSVAAGIITQRGSGDIFQLYDTSTNVLTVEDGGKFGIGDFSSSSVQQALHVKGSDTKIYLEHVGGYDLTVSTNTGGGQCGILVNGGYLDLCSNNRDLVACLYGGQVGIGSAAPTAKLDVNGTSKFQDNVSFTTANGNGIIISKSSNYMMFGNSVTQYFGGSSMWLMHNGSTGYLHNETGSLYIRNNSAGDIYIQGKSGEDSIICNDNGSVQLYHDDSLRLATTAQGINVTTVGDTPQIGISQTTTTAYSVNGTLSFINSNNTTSQIQGRTGAASTTGDILFLCNTVGDESLAILEDGKVRVPDRGRFVVGTGNDLSLYHDNGGSGSHIENSGSNLTVRTTGTYLYMHGNNIHLRSQTGNETMLTAVVNNAVSLYYDASTYTTPKLQTTSTGTQIDTILKLYGAAGNPGKLQLQEGGALSEIRVERSTDTSSALLFGTEISGTTATRWKIDTAGHFIPGAVGSYDIGSTSAEIGDIFIADNKKVFLGSDQDFTLHHNNSHAIVKNTTGRLYVLSDDLWFKNQADNSNLARFLNGDSVLLYYAGDLKLQTYPTGINVTGKVVASGEIEASQDYPNFRPTLDLNFAAEKKLDPRITYRRTGPASYVDKFGIVRFVGDNVPRFDHDPTTRECKGLLIEETRTNYVPSSMDWSNDYWNNNDHISQDMTVANPDGTMGAYYRSGGSEVFAYPYVDLSTATTNIITVSLWVKERSGQSGNLDIEIFQQISGSVVSLGAFSFNPATAVISTNDANFSDGKVVEYPNGWYRISAKVTTGSGNFTSTSRIDFQNTQHFFWGPQIEKGSFVTSFIPTYGSGAESTNATRGADLAEIDGEDFTDFFNQTEGTINCAYWLGNDNSGMRVFQINDSANSVIDIVAGSGSGAGGYGFVNTGGVAQANGGQSSTNANYLNKLHVTTLAYKANDIAGINRNTGVLTNDTSATLDGAYNRVTFYQHSNTADQLNGHLQRVQYYPKRLSDNQLKNLNNQ